MSNQKKNLVTTDLGCASKLIEKIDYLAKSKILLEMVGLYHWKLCLC
jgi:hypothetical protein